MAEGKHHFHYVLDNAFFDSFETTKGTEGKLEAEVEILKSNLLMEVKMKFSGTVRACCDRCLEMFDLPLSGEMDLFVKQGTRESGNDDDYIVLAPEEDFLDISTYLYEMYMLHYPMKVVHEEGRCDREMEEMLGKYVRNEEDKPTDPRWDVLKKLINN